MPEMNPRGLVDPDDAGAGRERHRAGQVAMRHQLLTLDPSGVRDDLDAAAACECGCHPRPGSRELHPSGVCPCQFSAEERAEHLAEAERAVEAVHQANVESWTERAGLLAQVAAELGVNATEEIPAAPWVVTGSVDGRAFYMRERWDSYSIVIAPDERPGLDVWSAVDEPGLTIREGRIGDFLASDGTIDYRVALPFVVDVVRAELWRRTCWHPTRSGDRFCPRCGASQDGPAALTTPAADAEGGEHGDRVAEFIEQIDLARMRGGARLSAVSAARASYLAAESSLTDAVASARAGGDSWTLIAGALDTTAREAMDRYEGRVDE